MAFRLHEALGTQNERYFVAATPPAHSLACLRIDDPVTAAAARLATGVGGLAPHRTGFAPAGRQTEFHDVIASSLPSDQPCLVAPCTNADVKQGGTRVFYSPRVRTQMWACCSQCSPNFKRGRSTSPGPCCQTGAHPPVYCRPRPAGASLRLPARRHALASFFVMFRCPGQGRGDDTVRLPHHHRGTPPRDGSKRPDLGQCHPKSVAGGIQTTLFVTATPGVAQRTEEEESRSVSRTPGSDRPPTDALRFPTSSRQMSPPVRCRR